jgi:hypothetical protein
MVILAEQRDPAVRENETAVLNKSSHTLVLRKNGTQLYRSTCNKELCDQDSERSRFPSDALRVSVSSCHGNGTFETVANNDRIHSCYGTLMPTCFHFFPRECSLKMLHRCSVDVTCHLRESRRQPLLSPPPRDYACTKDTYHAHTCCTSHGKARFSISCNTCST